jgi:hypothetical protein
MNSASTPPSPDDLDRRMGEAAALSPEHPLRQAVVREVVTLGADVERRWLDLLRADEQLRLELARVNPPPGLHDRLLAIPDDVRPRAWWRSPGRLAIGIAAMVLFSIGVVLFVPEVAPAPGAGKNLGRVAVLTATSATSASPTQPRPQAMEVNSSDWAKVVEALDDRAPFRLARPALRGDARLLGASLATLDDHPVLVSLWTDGNRTFPVYQYRAGDFGISGPVERTIMCPMEAAGHPRMRCRVILWSDANGDYALVLDVGDLPDDQLPA